MNANWKTTEIGTGWLSTDNFEINVVPYGEKVYLHIRTKNDRFPNIKSKSNESDSGGIYTEIDETILVTFDDSAEIVQVYIPEAGAFAVRYIDLNDVQADIKKRHFLFYIYCILDKAAKTEKAHVTSLYVFRESGSKIRIGGFVDNINHEGHVVDALFVNNPDEIIDYLDQIGFEPLKVEPTSKNQYAKYKISKSDLEEIIKNFNF